MIFVITGTNGPPFDRLLRVVESIGTTEPILVQYGPSKVRPANATCVEYLSLPETSEKIKEARIVVTHCGVGSILTCLANGRRPVVVPRLARAGEVADDHQVELGRRLDSEGFVFFVEHPEDLVATLTSRDDHSLEFEVKGRGPLVDELRAYLVEAGGHVSGGGTRRKWHRRT